MTPRLPRCDGIECWIVCHRRLGHVLAMGRTQHDAARALNAAGWIDPRHGPWTAQALRRRKDPIVRMHKAVASIPEYDP